MSVHSSPAAHAAVRQASMSRHADAADMPIAQLKPASIMQLVEQPSPAFSLPSSHVSLPFIAPSPQRVPQSSEQLVVVSSALHTRSPQLGAWQRAFLQTRL
jgi:hypothetical protein